MSKHALRLCVHISLELIYESVDAYVVEVSVFGLSDVDHLELS